MKQTDVLRSEECIKLYKENYKEGVSLLSLPCIKQWNYWRLIKNDYPYDKIAESHYLLIPLSGFAEDEEMNNDERKELFSIKNELSETKTFDAIFENLKHDRSIQTFYHLHCIKFKYRTPVNEFTHKHQDERQIELPL
jgi:diadenosine tetraphosphate (Ap4A) HIT family hydrolase